MMMVMIKKGETNHFENGLLLPAKKAEIGHIMNGERYNVASQVTHVGMHSNKRKLNRTAYKTLTNNYPTTFFFYSPPPI